MPNIIKPDSVISTITKQTMTLKEITDLLDVRHRDAMKVVDKMIENQEFGLAAKISLPIKSGKGRIQHIQTYQLDKRQSIAVSARLNTSLLMKVVDRWQELEVSVKQKPQLRVSEMYERALLNVHIPPGYISILNLTLDKVMSALESVGYNFLRVNRKHMPDISVGQLYVKHLKAQGLKPEDVGAKKYWHRFTDGRPPQKAWCYPIERASDIYTFIIKEWIPFLMVNYLKGIDGNLDAIALGKVILPLLQGNFTGIQYEDVIRTPKLLSNQQPPELSLDLPKLKEIPPRPEQERLFG